jgi:transcriptional regulator with XRE-family HTH domain
VAENPEEGSRPTEILATEELGRLIRERREANNLSVRQAARDADVSFATLARVEEGSQPDFVTFMKLSAWLGRAPSTFFRSVAERPTGHLELALGHLAADPRLAADAAERITALVRDLYQALAQPLQVTTAMNVHLRASAVMRTGVPERLVGILEDMESALTDRIARGEL